MSPSLECLSTIQRKPLPARREGRGVKTKGKSTTLSGYGRSRPLESLRMGVPRRTRPSCVYVRVLAVHIWRAITLLCTRGRTADLASLVLYGHNEMANSFMAQLESMEWKAVTWLVRMPILYYCLCKSH